MNKRTEPNLTARQASQFFNEIMADIHNAVPIRLETLGKREKLLTIAVTDETRLDSMLDSIGSRTSPAKKTTYHVVLEQVSYQRLRDHRSEVYDIPAGRFGVQADEEVPIVGPSLTCPFYSS
jgi:hypothetical protein